MDYGGCGPSPICGRNCGVSVDDEGCLTCVCLQKGPRSEATMIYMGSP